MEYAPELCLFQFALDQNQNSVGCLNIEFANIYLFIGNPRDP